MPSLKDSKRWARQQFKGVKLGDKRRNARAMELTAAMLAQQGGSIPRLCGTAYDVKASYNLFKHPESTPDNLQAGHRELVRKRITRPGAYLLVEDLTELIWYDDEPIPGLGPVGASRDFQQGFLLESVLAIVWQGLEATPEGARRPALEVVGLVDQQYQTRKPIPEGEKDNSFNRKRRERESQIWERSNERLGEAPASVEWCRVCDRGADVYEFLASCQSLRHQFVVRAAQDRALLGAEGKLFQQARSAPSLGSFELELRSRPGQAARTATLSLSTCRVTLRPPQRPKGTPKLEPLTCSIVRVWEAKPPAGIKPLEWILLVSAPVESLEDALEATMRYTSRWLIEEFHKALKSCLGAERLHLEDGHRLAAAISLQSLAAARLVQLKEALRLDPNAPATTLEWDPLVLKILEKRTKRKLRTIQDVALAIGRMGGHMNRKADGMPGLVTLARGYRELEILVAGARIALGLEQFG
ncbi:MAG TPA: IS4 family transposase [Oscillatoriaceae cyanobacterium]